MSKYSKNIPPDLLGAVGWMIDKIKPSTTLLDVGCSTGYFGNYLKDTKGCTVYGIEISEDVNEARKVLDGVYSFDLDGEWPKEVYERKYDYLFFGDVIEHLKDPQKVLEKSKGLLTEKGIIFISTPNVAHISVRLELMSGNFEYESMGILDNTHLKYFTKRSLIELVKNAGYELKSIDFTANDYPDNVIKTILAKIGLVPQDKFWKMIDKPEARAFQYKLAIQPKKTKKSSSQQSPKETASSEKPEQIRNAAMDDLQQKVEVLQKHAKEQAEIIKYYVNKNKELESTNELFQAEITLVQSSKAYKAKHALKKVLGKNN